MPASSPSNETDIAAFRLQAEREPQNPTAQHNYAQALARTGRIDAAFERLEAALQLRPGYPPSLYSKGRLLLLRRRYEEAIECLKGAAVADDYAADAFLSLADASRLLRRTDDAVEYYQRHLALAPRSMAGYVNLSQMLVGGAPLKAIAVLERGIAALPGLGILHGLRGQALLKLGRLQEAMTSLRQALALDPGLHAARGDLLRAARESADWDEEARLTAELRRIIAVQPEDSRQLVLGAQNALFFAFDGPEVRVLARSEAAWRAGAVSAAISPTIRSAARPLRIGYLSPDYRNHPVMHLVADMFQHHDRANVHAIAYSIGAPGEDEWTSTVRAGVDAFVDLRQSDDRSAADRIRADDLDILVDLALYTQNCRPALPAQRLAPLQIAWLGFPGSSGAPWFDYAIVDRITVPPAQREHFSEKLIYMPHTYQPNAAWRDLGPPPPRTELGLPEDAFVFTCMNGHRKLDRGTFDAWMKIMAAVPASVLWLLDLPPETLDRLQKHMETAEIDPARLVMAPWLDRDRHLRRLAAADLFLDTLIYGAHTTASDALRRSVPVLTVAGERFASRVAASLLTVLGCEDLIAPSVERYCETAIALAHDPQQARNLSARLRARLPDSPLYDPRRFAADLEAAFTAVIERARRGDAPADIAVSGLAGE